jgi:hypothetical protein
LLHIACHFPWACPCRVPIWAILRGVGTLNR